MEEAKDVATPSKEELEEQEAALEALSQLSFDPALLSEINGIVDDAQEARAVQAGSEDGGGSQSTRYGSFDVGEASGSAQSNHASIVTKKERPKMSTETNDLASADAHVDEALVGCIDMIVSNDGSLVPASTQRGAEPITRNVTSLRDRDRRWRVDAKNLGKKVPAPMDVNDDVWQDMRISRFLEDLNTHRLKIAALYVTGVKFNPFNAERIGRCIWEDTGVKREGKFQFMIDVDLAYLSHSETTLSSLYKVVSPLVSGYCALKRIVLTQCCLGLNGTRTVVNACWNNIFVEELLISGNACTDAVVPDLIKTLRGSANRFRILGVGSNSLSDEHMEEFSAVLATHKYLKELHISGNTELGDVGVGHIIKALRDNMVVEVLNVSNCGVRECPFAGSLRIMGHLADLNLSQNEISDSGVRELCGGLEVCFSLRHLNLSYNHFGGKHSVRLGEMLENNRGLLSLDLSGNSGIYQMWNSLAVGLMKNDTLMHLNLTLCDIDIKAGERLYESLKKNDICDINLDLNPLPDALRLRPRAYRKDGLEPALPVAVNAPGEALIRGQTWRNERLGTVLTSKNTMKTIERLEDPAEREPLGWDRGALIQQLQDTSALKEGLTIDDEGSIGGSTAILEEGSLQRSLHGEPSMMSGSLSLSAPKTGEKDGSLSGVSLASPSKSLLTTLISDNNTKVRRDKEKEKRGNGEDDSVAGTSMAGSAASLKSTDMISLGARNMREKASLADRLDKGAENDNQGRLVLSVCYGRITELLGTIEVDTHTTYPEAKELMKPLVERYLAALGNLATASVLIEGFEVLDPERKLVKGEKASVRSIWSEASVNDHTVYVRPANWIGMEEDEQEMLEEEKRKKTLEEFVSVEYNDDKYHAREADDDVSVMTGASDVDSNAFATADLSVKIKKMKPAERWGV